VYRYWKNKAGARRMPARRDINPVDLVPFLPSIMLVDVYAPGPGSANAAPAPGQYVYRCCRDRGIPQKVVRLRLLDRFAQKAMENNYFIKAAAFMEQSAKECGGIYERKAPERSMGGPPKDPAP
jgi:hypothetical protein